MKKLTWFLLLLSFYKISSAQNLVPNGDFENYLNLPTSYGQITACLGWTNCGGTADGEYYNTASPIGTYFGTVTPHSGNGMIGLCTYHSGVPGLREYAGTQLTQPLTAGIQYRISFYLTSGTDGGYSEASDHIGVAFSTSPLVQSGNQNINVVPQAESTDTLCFPIWQQIIFYYTPVVNDQYMVFGNFRDDLNTNHVFCHIGSVLATYYFVDDFVVELATGVSSPTAETKVLFSPNPFHDFVELTFSGYEINSGYECEILDLTGKLISVTSIHSEKTLIPTHELASGIYFYRVRNRSTIINQGKLVKE